MNTGTLCVLVGLFISLIVLLIIGVSVIILIYYQLKLKRDLEEKKIIYEFDFKKDHFEILDAMITESITRYQVLNFGFEQGEIYINEKQQKKMVEYILTDILGKMSPVYYNHLVMIYNSDKLEDIIFEKISMGVMAYVQSTNSTLT